MLGLNPFAWNNFTNVLFLDQPVGTGYSFPKDGMDPNRTYSIDYAVTDFIHFMKLFYEMHPQFKGRELYLVGQDFIGGKYLPVFAYAIDEVKNGKFEDQEFENMYLSQSDKAWAEWFDLKGILVNSPVFDEAY